MKKTSFTFRTTEDFKEKIEEKAEKMGMNRTELIETAAEIFLNFDASFYVEMKDRAEKLKLPVGVVIQNFIAKKLAKLNAEKKFWNKEYNTGAPGKVLSEFQITQTGPLGFMEVFEQEKVKEYQRQIKKQLNYLNNLNENLLDEKDKKFLKKYGSNSVSGSDDQAADWLE